LREWLPVKVLFARRIEGNHFLQFDFRIQQRLRRRGFHLWIGTNGILCKSGKKNGESQK